MGIPSFFRWISSKYPKIMVNCIEHASYNEDIGAFLPVDASAPNPNGVEYDNLYLDMNGIIHPCSHPEDRPAPMTEAAIHDTIFDYIDRIFAIVRPRKLIYLAIDGVAPRAKINQQRVRRFRASHESKQKMEAANKLLAEWGNIGLCVAGDKWSKDQTSSKDSDQHHQDVDADPSTISFAEHPFDSNVITPGTPFMARLSIALRRFIQQRIEKSHAWRDIKIIFSDASVPGEGEHKIAEFIRRERAIQGYNPNLKHVMYGLDADLIMLALATHEVNFTIIREEVQFNNRPGPNFGKSPSTPKSNGQQAVATQEPALSTQAELGGRKPFVFLHVHVLREYLDFEFRNDIEVEISTADNGGLVYDFERVIDDFILLCFFVGNDFLPHLPTLDIREGAIEYLIELYKTEVVNTGYLTSTEGNVDFGALRHLMVKTGEQEDEIFRTRANRNTPTKQFVSSGLSTKRSADDLAQPRNSDLAHRPAKRAASDATPEFKDTKQKLLEQTVELGRKPTGPIGTAEGRATATAALASSFRRRGSTAEQAHSEPPSANEDVDCAPNSADVIAVSEGSNGKDIDSHDKKKSITPIVKKSEAEFESALNERLNDMNNLERVDNVRLNEHGWKERYYSQKFEWGENHSTEKQKLLQKYIEGLQWVMKYYFVGCTSWSWHYPYHYAPFASDLAEADLTSEDIKFEIGRPYKPFMQLLSVMPPDTGKIVLPKCYSDLMTDPKSPLIEYYPETLKFDMDGKRFIWQAVILLPFVDEQKLLHAVGSLDHLLTAEEQKRNARGDCHIVTHRESPLGRIRNSHAASDEHDLDKIPKKVADGLLFGKASYPLSKYGGHTGSVYTLTFKLPKYTPHLSKILPSANMPTAMVSDPKNDAWNKCWKHPLRGPLGRAAQGLRMARQRRFGSRHGRSGFTEYRNYQTPHLLENFNKGPTTRNMWDAPSEAISASWPSGNTNFQNNFSSPWSYSQAQRNGHGNRSNSLNVEGYSGYASNGGGQRSWGNWKDQSGNQRRQAHVNAIHSWDQTYYNGPQQYGGPPQYNAQGSQPFYNYSNHSPDYSNEQNPNHRNGPDADMHANSRSSFNPRGGTQNTFGNDSRNRSQMRGGGLNGPTAASLRQMNQSNRSTSYRSNRERNHWTS